MAAYGQDVLDDQPADDEQARAITRALRMRAGNAPGPGAGPIPPFPQGIADTPSISDNSFLVEEAYNQERDVVQHISTLTRVWETRSWAYSFTQEWPVNPAPRHQLSYSLAVLSPGEADAGAGFGDLMLHYRYQVIQNERLAFAPRASLLLPTGSYESSRGTGGTGFEFNLPLSVRAAERLVTHWNLGAAVIPRARNEAGDVASTTGVLLGQSLVWEAHPRFHALLETVHSRQQVVTGPGRRAWESSTVLNPGIRWSHNFPSGLQIVPGVAFPVEVGPAAGGEWGVILYLSFEYFFSRPAMD